MTKRVDVLWHWGCDCDWRLGWGRWGPQSRPDWWMFRWLLLGPLEVRLWRRDIPWERFTEGATNDRSADTA